jgi:hypothetical protein
MAYNFRLICALALSLGSLPAQDTPQEQGTSKSPDVGQAPRKNRPPDFRRWGIGGIFSYTPFNLMRGGAATQTTSEQYTDTLGSASKSRPLGGGVAGYFYLTRTLSLNLDFIYRRTGYDATTSLNDPLTTMTFDRTRANYYDFPLLARYHLSKYHLLHSPVFIEAGGTMRYVDQITTSTTVDTTVNSALVSNCCSEVPDRPAHRIVYGPTVGFGLRLLPDEFGVRITPEIRYTRWLDATFSSGPTKSNHDQAEVLISITF